MSRLLSDLLERALQAAPMMIGNRIIAQFEPIPRSLSFREEHARAVRNAIDSVGHDGFATFSTPIGRNAFLVGTFDHLEAVEDREELIVGLGKRRGSSDESPTLLYGLWRGIGDRDEVGMTPLLRDTISKQAAALDRSEVIFVHNHPAHDVKSLIRFLFGWTPLASSSDRDTALRMNTMAALKSMVGLSNHYRFYLVDEGRLARFWLPPLEWFLVALQKLGGISQAGSRRS